MASFFKVLCILSCLPFCRKRWELVYLDCNCIVCILPIISSPDMAVFNRAISIFGGFSTCSTTGSGRGQFVADWLHTGVEQVLFLLCVSC